MIGLWTDGIFPFLMSVGTGADLLPWCRARGAFCARLVTGQKRSQSCFGAQSRSGVGTKAILGGACGKGVSGLLTFGPSLVPMARDLPPHGAGESA